MMKEDLVGNICCYNDYVSLLRYVISFLSLHDGDLTVYDDDEVLVFKGSSRKGRVLVYDDKEIVVFDG